MAIKGGDPILEKQNWSTWFFGMCAFMAFCYGCVIYQEFVSRRTYIYYQTLFRSFDHDKTQAEFDAFKKSWTGAAKEQELKSAKDAAEAKLKEPAYRDAKKNRPSQFLAKGYAKSERAKVKSTQDAVFYDWKHALHEANQKEAAAKEHEYWHLDVELKGLKELPAAVFVKTDKGETPCVGEVTPSDAPDEVKKEFKADYLSWDDRLYEETKKLCEIDQVVDETEKAVKNAQKAYDDFREPITKFEERLDKIDHRSVRLVDQIVNDRLGIGGAYTFGTVDRCRSCHVAIDKKGYEIRRADAESGHFSFQGVPDSGDPLSRYRRYAAVLGTHPDIDTLFVKHPVETYGCTVCHGGQGRATRIKTEYPWQKPDDFVFLLDMDQAHGPAREHGAHQWEDPLHDRIDASGDFVQSNCQKCHAPQRWLDLAPVYEKGKDLFIQKGCHGCHVIKGYEDLPRIGPELYKIKGKVKPEWLISWIYNPRDFYENTRMPMFVFDDVQVGAPDPRQNVAVMARKDLQRETATKIAAYLWQSSEAEKPYPFGRFPGGGEPAKGLKTIETVGCLGCHVLRDDQIGKDVGTGRAPPLDKAGAKMASEDWIWNWIHEPRWHSGTTRMPNLRLNEEEARNVTAWLWQAGKNAPVAKDPELAKELPALVKKLEDPEMARAGGLLIAQWGCFGCHAIKGHEKDGRIGPELTLFGDKKPYELAFGDTKVKEDWLDWTTGKLKNPRQYVDVRAASRMPWFGLADDEVHALDVYLLGQRDPRVPDDMKKQFIGRAERIEKGRALVNDFNCVGCHKIENRGGLILPFAKALAEKNGLVNSMGEPFARPLSPPYLNSEGLKIQSSYLLEFLKSPGGPNGAQGPQIRPWLKIRMPTFPLTDEERADIVAYFRAVDDVEDPYDIVATSGFDPAQVAKGEVLFSHRSDEKPDGMNCQSCHVFRGQRRASAVEENVAPDLANVWRRFRPDGLRVWLEAPQKAMPGAAMPAFWFDWDKKKDKNPTGPASVESLAPSRTPPGGALLTPEQDEREIDAIRQYLFSLGHSQQVSMR